MLTELVVTEKPQIILLKIYASITFVPTFLTNANFVIFSVDFFGVKFEYISWNYCN